MTILEDDKDFFVQYQGAMTLRQDTLDEYPELAEIMDPISEKLTNEVMMELNGRVDTDGEMPEDVAEEWLEDQGLIGGCSPPILKGAPPLCHALGWGSSAAAPLGPRSTRHAGVSAGCVLSVSEPADSDTGVDALERTGEHTVVDEFLISSQRRLKDIGFGFEFLRGDRGFEMLSAHIVHSCAFAELLFASPQHLLGQPPVEGASQQPPDRAGVGDQLPLRGQSHGQFHHVEVEGGEAGLDAESPGDSVHPLQPADVHSLERVEQFGVQLLAHIVSSVMGVSGEELISAFADQDDLDMSCGQSGDEEVRHCRVHERRVEGLETSDHLGHHVDRVFGGVDEF